MLTAASLSSFPGFLVSRPFSFALRLSLSLSLSISRFRSIPLCRYCLCLAHDRSITPVCGGSHGGLFTEREPRKQKNHAAEQHVCCARTDRTSHPRTYYTFLRAHSKIQVPGSRILIANDQLLAIYRKGEKERTVSIIDTRLDSILLVLDRIDSICGEKCIWRTRSISNRRVRSINTRNIREYRS